MKRFKKCNWQSTENLEFMNKKKSIFENVMAILLKDMPSKGVISPVLAFEKKIVMKDYAKQRKCQNKYFEFHTEISLKSLNWTLKRNPFTSNDVG